MAGKLKGQGGIKGLLLLHGEKIAISLVGLIALLLIYKTTSLPRLEDKFQAAKLREEINQTSSAVRDAQWPEPTSELATEVRPFKPIGEKADKAVPSEPYKIDQGLDTTIVASSERRPDPQLVNAMDVRGTGGSGLFAFIDEEVRKQRDLARAKEEQERARKEAERQAKEAQATAKGGGPEGGANRRSRGQDAFGEGAANQLFDPAHPKRRPLYGMAQALGVPLQGGERVEQAYWAIVVAKVPIREQLKRYQDAFEKAKLGFDPARDFPQYKGYFVQRAEVVPGKDLDWKPVPVYAGEHKFIVANQPISPNGVGQPVMDKLYEIASKTWAGMSPNVIDPRFSDYVLTFPLPPLVGRDWGPEATHPDIPLLADTPPLEEEVSQLTTDSPDQRRAVDSPFGATDPTLSNPGFPMPGRGAGMGRGGFPGLGGRFGGEGGERSFRPSMGRGPEGEGSRGLGGGGRYSGGGAMAGPGGARTSLPKGLDYLLLRFFDFTVEPGKKYKYRVSLVLSDANYSMPDNVLAPEVLDRHAKENQAARAKNSVRPDIRLVEGWSDPSPTVGIPLAGSVKLVDVKPWTPEKINDEPTANLLVEAFDVDEKGNAIQAANKKEFRRGGVANMVEDAKYLGEGWIDVWKGFKFNTGMTVLDIDGGKQLTKNYKSPGRVLLMGPAGELYIRNELDDKLAVQYHDLLYETDDKRRPGGEGGPEAGFGGRGRGGRER